MNILIIKPEELVGRTSAHLTGARARYVYEFHALKVGLDIRAGLLNGLLGRAQVEHVSMTDVRLQVNFDTAPQVLSALEIVLAIPRPQIMKKVLGLVCELGVSRLILVKAERTQKSYLDSHILRPADMLHYLIKGLEQSATTLLPQITIVKSISEALKATTTRSKLRLLAHAEEGSYNNRTEQSCRPIGIKSGLSLGQQDFATLAVGPEAGWSSDEVDLFLQSEYQQIFLGQRVLRVDTALTVLAGQLAQIRSCS